MGKPTPRLTLDTFRAANARFKGIHCSLWQFLQALDPKDVAVVRDALCDVSIQAAAIARVLKGMGFDRSAQIVQRHRRLGCRDCDAAWPR